MANSVKTGRKLLYRCLQSKDNTCLFTQDSKLVWFEIETRSSLNRLRYRLLDGIAVQVIDVPFKFVWKNNVTQNSTPVLGLYRLIQLIEQLNHHRSTSSGLIAEN